MIKGQLEQEKVMTVLYIHAPYPRAPGYLKQLLLNITEEINSYMVPTWDPGMY